MAMVIVLFLQISRLSFDTQIENFKDSMQELSGLVGQGAPLTDYLSKSLFAIVFGSNDYLNNYLINSTGYSQQYTPDAYRLFVAQQFAKQLMVNHQITLSLLFLDLFVIFLDITPICIV